MVHRFVHPILAAILLFVSAFLAVSPSQAEANQAPLSEDSAYDLVNAVNALRSANGLPAYAVNSILMYTAQNQAEFMAATGMVTHSGPGGVSLTDRLLAAGYPLAGDLALGGFRSENILSGSKDMSAQSAVDQWSGDAPHLNTMLSPNLTEMGAGVAVAGGMVYYVIDAARPTAAQAPQALTPPPSGGSAVPPAEAPISVVLVSTPNQNGEVIHEVLSGQTLWQIAISYDVKIDEIKRLNNLFDNNIYPGNRLLIKKAQAALTETPTALPTFTATIPPVTSTATPKTTITPTSMPTVPPEKQPGHSTLVGVMLGIIILAFLGGGFFIRRGTSTTTSR